MTIFAIETKLKFLFRQTSELLYPRICPGCGQSLLKREAHVCIECLIDLPYTNLYDQSNNIVEERLASKTSFQHATALFYFRKDSKAQKLIHSIKYRDGVDVAILLGRILGDGLQKSKRFQNIDFVIPVPLHPKRLRERGYNQSEQIAIGISKELDNEVLANNLTRNNHTSSQTRKSIYDRWLNVAEIFQVQDPLTLENKKILLVDDVVTSGSTIEACASELNKVKGITIFIAVLACAE